MMQAAEYWLRNNASLVWGLNFSRRWRVAVERLMWAIQVVVLEGLAENSNQMCLVQNDDVFKALGTRDESSRSGARRIRTATVSVVPSALP